jgi:hypothetical protein
MERERERYGETRAEQDARAIRSGVGYGSLISLVWWLVLCVLAVML